MAIETTVRDPSIRKKLFQIAMRGEWEQVKTMYEMNPSLHKEKITRSGRTALHIAVSDGREDIVQELVKIIGYEALTVEDERGYTPLHTAAALGRVKMCKCIAEKHSSLIADRNNDGETPFFLAALHGHKDAFLLLHSLCGNKEAGYSYSRRNDGNTILHCAISRDYLDLAFQIVHLYKDLVNSLNERGQSPLHLLAAKPSAFRSGSRLGRFKRFIYHCTFVDKLKRISEETISSQFKSISTDEKKAYEWPRNYETCCNVGYLLKDMVKENIGGESTEENSIENPHQSEETNSGPRSVRKFVSFKFIARLKELAVKQEDRSRIEADPQSHHQLFPPNSESIFIFVKLVSKAMLIILGLGSNEIKKIREKKERHTWSAQVLDELLQNVSMYEYEDDGRKPLAGYETMFDFGTKPTADSSDDQMKNQSHNEPDPSKKDQNKATNAKDSNKGEKQERVREMSKSGSTDMVQMINEKIPSAETTTKETPVLIAAMNGITEIVEGILRQFPVAIHDTTSDKKNIVLLAVENRQPHVYQLLLEITTMKDNVFRKVDNEGNSALHLAATLGDHKPWLIPGAALQMQWELKWYEFVKDSMPFHFFPRYNKVGKTPKEIFTKTHQVLVEAGSQWLIKTSESCSVVAALIATVAFATSTTVPGGVQADSGTPTLKDEPAFNLFAVSSLLALCFSVTAVLVFLSILTSRYQEKDFAEVLPRKLLVGLTSLFVSIASMLISFCAGHFFVLKDKLKYAAFPVYAVTCLPVTFFAIAQFPLYFDLIWATLKKVPQRSYKSVLL